MKPQAKTVQYTIRGVPEAVDKALREKVTRRKQSLNQVILDELTAVTGKRPRDGWIFRIWSGRGSRIRNPTKYWYAFCNTI